jgi:predicted acylesterase/phospholipase RssA
MALMLCVGYPPREIADFLRGKPIKSLLADTLSFHGLLQEGALMNLGGMTVAITDALSHKGHDASTLTFRSLQDKTGKTFRVVANMAKGARGIVVFDTSSAPEVLVVDAVKASMALPFVFATVPVRGIEYFDSGAFNNCPFDLMGDPEDLVALASHEAECDATESIWDRLWTATMIRSSFLARASRVRARAAWVAYMPCSPPGTHLFRVDDVDTAMERGALAVLARAQQGPTAGRFVALVLGVGWLRTHLNGRQHPRQGTPSGGPLKRCPKGDEAAPPWTRDPTRGEPVAPRSDSVGACVRMEREHCSPVLRASSTC